MLEHLKSHLKGKVVILGIGNSLRSDDGAGSILASRIKGRVSFVVFDAQISPENYLDKIIKEKPDTILIIDAVDFQGKPGEFRLLETEEIRTANLFSTHNASINLAINYLQTYITVDIIILIIQPKTIALGEGLSPEVGMALQKLEDCFKGAKMKTLAVFLLAVFLLLNISGCAPLVIGAVAVGGVGAYAAVSKDTIQGDTDKPYDLLWNAVLTVSRVRGEVKLEDAARAYLELQAAGSYAQIHLIRMTQTVTRVRITARKMHRYLPDMKLAQDLFTKIMEEAK